MAEPKSVISSPSPEGNALEQSGSDDSFYESSKVNFEKWLVKIDPKAKVTTSQPGKPHHLSFKFRRPWKLTFDSPTGSSPSPRGLENRQRPDFIYCELNTATPIPSTVGKLYRYIGLSGMKKYVPNILWNLEVKLKQSSASQNAMWYNPSAKNETTFRLEFVLKDSKPWDSLFENPLIRLETPTLICKRRLTEVQTAQGLLAACQGRLAFCVNVKTMPGDDTTGVKSVLEFQETSVRLVIDFGDKFEIDEIFSWLLNLVNGGRSTKEHDQGTDESFPRPKEVFTEVKPRRVTIIFASPRNTKINLGSVRSFHLDVEASVKMGKGQEGPVTFLLSYEWFKEGPKLGSLRGKLWTIPARDPVPFQGPALEWWDQLRPTKEPAKYIELAKLIPGQTIHNIPDYIPHQISRIQIYISKERIEFGGSLSCNRSSDSTPQPFLGELNLDASYAFRSKTFTLEFGVNVEIRPVGCSATYSEPGALVGKIQYDSGQGIWGFDASLKGAHLSVLSGFFESPEQVMPLIESIEINHLAVKYTYHKEDEKKKDEDKKQNEKGQEPKKTSKGSFSITGTVFIAGLSLDLSYKHPERELKASLKQQESRPSTMGDLVNSLLGGRHELPEFLGQISISSNNAVGLTVTQDEEQKTWALAAQLNFGPIRIIFAQYVPRKPDENKNSYPKRLINVGFRGDAIQFPDVPLVGPIKAPFQELTYTWVHDSTPVQEESQALTRKTGFTKKELTELKSAIESMITGETLRINFHSDESTDIILKPGSHFAIWGSSGRLEAPCLLHYDADTPNTGSNGESGDETAGTEDLDGEQATQAPLKTRSGPLSLSSMGLTLMGKELVFSLDGSVEAGPVAFALLGLKIKWKVTLDAPPNPGDFSWELQGMSVAVQRDPLTIAGSFRRMDPSSRMTDAYAGALILGYEPYLLQATGTYQTISLGGGKSFSSLFVHARLQGPLMTVGYAEISGVQGGFGYNSSFRTPRIKDINDHYFSPKTFDQGTLTAATLHQKMQDIVKPGGWFEPKEASSWVAAGLSIKAFQMISLSAVLALELNSSITITVLAIGTVDIPSPQAELKFAHVELGFQAVVEVDYGTLFASAELLPGSFILHPDCHLTGGFGLAYWFDGPKADKSRVGEYVFTLGGYHKAFDPPKDYPKPPRLTIGWTISSSLCIRGEAYFAINPKACMAGGRLHASLDKGWVRAWFDAFLDLLINYEPFQFEAVIHINAGVGYTLGKGILAVSGSLEVGAELTLWGPPLAGRVRIDCWVHSFEIGFGDPKQSVSWPSLLDFYRTALQIKDSNNAESRSQTLDYTRPRNEGHIFRVISGLVNGEDESVNSSEGRQDTNGWTVQAGTLSLLVACKIPIQTLNIPGATALEHDTPIYAKPMRGTEPLTSKVTVSIKVSDGAAVNLDEWTLEKQLGPAPKALWDKYDPDNDPVRSGHGTKELLDCRGGNVKLMTGFTLRAPRPQMSPDNLAKILHHDGTERLESEFPEAEEASKEWLPASRKEGREQWVDVHGVWSRRKPPIMEPDSPQKQGQKQQRMQQRQKPRQQQGQQQGHASSLREAPNTPHKDHNTQENAATQFVTKWEALMNWEQGTLSKFATMPKQMDDRFMRLFVVAPSISG